MAGSHSGSRVTMEVFVKEDQITPVRVSLELFEIPEHRATTSLILQEYVRHTARQFSRYLPQGHHLSRPGWELDLEIVSEVVMELLERLDQQVIHWEPDRTAPIGVAAEQPSRRLAWLVVDPMLHVLRGELVRVVPM